MVTKKDSSPKASDESVPVREKDVLARKNNDGTVAVMRLDNDEYFFTIDGIAAQIWLMIDGKTSIGRIKTALEKKFNPPKEQFARDVSRLMGQFKKERLIRI